MDTKSDTNGSEQPQDERTSFPSNAVVGVVNTPEDLVGVTKGLRSKGVTPQVYCGEKAEQAIAHGDHAEIDVKATRLVRGAFGFENEHADRHMAEVDAGHYVVLAGSDDEETAETIRDVFAANGGHFVNYYSSWTSQRMLP